MHARDYINMALNGDADSAVLALHNKHGAVVAATSFTLKEGEVHISAMGSLMPGKGGEMLRHIISIAGARKVTVLAENKVVGFYQKFGFKPVNVGVCNTDMVREAS